jgi:hypothetical protein
LSDAEVAIRLETDATTSEEGATASTGIMLTWVVEGRTKAGVLTVVSEVSRGKKETYHKW